MNRRVFIRNGAGCIAWISGVSMFSSCAGEKEHYVPDDFAKALKADAHFHYDALNDAFLKYAGSINMHIVTINVDAGESIDFQLQVGQTLKKDHPTLVDFLGTIDISTYGSDTFADDAITRIKASINAGAGGIKIWKNIGMTLLDKDGKYVMADDPAFAPVYAYLEKEGITLAAHLGEPRNCWLPYDEITMGNDLNYYTHHPQYHMYQHPEAPTYEQQIEARDHILERYPNLKFVGCHIGSLEWNLDEVAARFEKYPNFNVDLAARVGHVQLHASKNREKVRDFFIKYQDRVLYGSDFDVVETSSEHYEEKCKALYDGWKNEWMFFATDETLTADKMNIPDAPETIQGLQLPKKVVDKIFHGNARRLYSK